MVPAVLLMSKDVLKAERLAEMQKREAERQRQEVTIPRPVAVLWVSENAGRCVEATFDS